MKGVLLAKISQILRPKSPICKAEAGEYSTMDIWRRLVASESFTQVFEEPPSIWHARNHAELPLAGLIYGTKEMFAVKSRTSWFGSRDLEARASFGVSSVESALTSMLDELGAYNVGFTAMTELALYAPSPIKNAWDDLRSAGGSSSGSAVAVSQGLVDFAIGSQTGGSITRPASFNGVLGFKPSFGVLPVHGMLPIAPSLDTAGLFASNLEMLEYVFRTLVDAQNCNDAHQACSKETIRIGVFRDDSNPYSHCMEDCAKGVFNAVVEELRKIDWIQVSEVEFPASFRHTDAITLANYEARLNLAGFFSTRVLSLLSPPMLTTIGNLKNVSYQEYADARKVQIMAKKDTLSLFEDVDILISPSTIGIAPRLDECLGSMYPSGDPWINCALTFFGVPTIHLPIGEDTRTGMPLGVQLIGRQLDDFKVLAYAKRLLLALETSMKKLSIECV